VRHRVAHPDPWQVWLYSSTDYAALELATLSQCCINLGFKSVMADAINAKQDLHVRMAARVLSLSYEDCYRQYKKEKLPHVVELRQTMKPVNYGLGGLMGPPKLVLTARKEGAYFCEGAGKTPRGKRPGDGCAKVPRRTDWGRGRANRKIAPTCEVCLELAAHYKTLWYEEFPEMADYHECTIEVARLAEEGQPLESFGTGMLRLERSANACSNHYFQNLAAQGAKNAAWLICKESYTDRRSVLYNNLRLSPFLHDETFAEVREPVAHECSYRQSELMALGMKPFVPDVLIEAPPAVMRRWFKGAELAWDRNGRIKPWWPVDPECRATWPVHRADGKKCSCWKWAADQRQMGVDLAA
jgi:hypothetical protein